MNWKQGLFRLYCAVWFLSVVAVSVVAAYGAYTQARFGTGDKVFLATVVIAPAIVLALILWVVRGFERKNEQTLK